MVTFFSSSFQFGCWVIQQGLLKLHYSHHSETFWMETNSYFYSRLLFKRKTLNSMQVFSVVPLWIWFFCFGHPPHLQLSSFTVVSQKKKVLILCVIFVQLLNFLSLFGDVIFFSSNTQATVSCLMEISFFSVELLIRKLKNCNLLVQLCFICFVHSIWV